MGTFCESFSPCCHSVCLGNTQLLQHFQDFLRALSLLRSSSLHLSLSAAFLRPVSSASTWFFHALPSRLSLVMISEASDSVQLPSSFSQHAEETVFPPPVLCRLSPVHLPVQIFNHAKQSHKYCTDSTDLFLHVALRNPPANFGDSYQALHPPV